MSFEIKMTPEELVFLAIKCEGNALDYDYINMMEDVQVRASVIEDDIIQSLSDKKILKEVWGELLFDESAVNILNPIWNGNFQVTVSLIDNENKKTVIRFHIKGDKYVCVINHEGTHVMSVRESSKMDLEAFAETFIRDAHHAVYSEIKMANLKTNEGMAVVEEFVFEDEHIYRPENVGYEEVPFSEFDNIINTVLKGK